MDDDLLEPSFGGRGGLGAVLRAGSCHDSWAFGRDDITLPERVSDATSPARSSSERGSRQLVRAYSSLKALVMSGQTTNRSSTMP